MEARRLKLYSKSGVGVDWRCPRARYWNYEYEGKGIVSGNTHLELYLGQAIHDALAAIAVFQQQGSVDIDLVATTSHKQVLEALLSETTGELSEVDFASEQAALVEGLIRGFFKAVWPNLIQHYPTIIAVEKEMLFRHNNLAFMSKPDLILADVDGNWHYLEYKTTSSKTESWINSWATAIQLHSSIRAVEQTLGTAPTSVIIQGLYKGYNSYGKQGSPFCYAYRRNGSPPFSVTETIYEYRSGFKRVPTWELVGGVKEWVAGMPDSVLADQFPQSPPIFVKDELINAFFAQRNMRENEILLANQLLQEADDEAKEAILNTTYSQRFDQCIPSFGKSCQYLKLCHGPKVDPLTAGYQYRDEDHLKEFRELADAL